MEDRSSGRMRTLVTQMARLEACADGLDLHSIAEVGQTFDQALLLLIGGAAIEVITAKVFVHRAILARRSLIFGAVDTALRIGSELPRPLVEVEYRRVRVASRMTAIDPGCMKTRTLFFKVEFWR